MKLTKNAVRTLINKSGSKIDAIHLSPDEIPQDRNRTINQLKHDIDRKMRLKKELTIILIEQ